VLGSGWGGGRGRWLLRNSVASCRRTCINHMWRIKVEAGADDNTVSSAVQMSTGTEMGDLHTRK
jgi:hypothetical protein